MVKLVNEIEKNKLFSIKDYNLMSNNIFKELLLESVDKARILNSMKNRVVNLIYYSGIGHDGEPIKSGYRSIEPFALGLNHKNKLVLIAWLRNDFSKTLKSGKKRDAIRWRMFVVENIRSFQNTIQKFDTDPAFLAANRPKLNLGYKNLSTVYYKIDPANPTK